MNKFLRVLLAVFSLALALSSISAMVGPLVDVSAQITPIDEEPDDAPGLGSIVGSPEAGPKPEDPGDRGGYAQLGLAVVLLAGVAFIASRVVREARRTKSQQAPDFDVEATQSDGRVL